MPATFNNMQKGRHRQSHHLPSPQTGDVRELYVPLIPVTNSQRVQQQGPSSAISPQTAPTLASQLWQTLGQTLPPAAERKPAHSYPGSPPRLTAAAEICASRQASQMKSRRPRCTDVRCRITSVVHGLPHSPHSGISAPGPPSPIPATLTGMDSADTSFRPF